MIEKVTRIGYLYDIYGPLLTPRQREMVELHYFDDWSLAEIAEKLQVTRQAVHDNLRRAEEQLEGYEAALQMWSQQSSLRALIAALVDGWTAARAYVPEDLRRQLDAAVQGLADRYPPG